MGVSSEYISEFKENIEYYMLLQGEETKLPEDIKIRININNLKDGFIGVYGQINNNMVSGTAYLYFYVVLVAKSGFGLNDIFNEITPP